MQIADGEGSSTQPSLTLDMMETVRSLAHSEAAREVEARNAEIEELKKRQREMEEEMRRKTREYEESMRIFQQFMQQFRGHDNQGQNDNEDSNIDEEN